MKSVFNKEGGHYNIFDVPEREGMSVLRNMFPEGKANAMNFVLFSTSGVHGTYSTIEDEQNPCDEVIEDHNQDGTEHVPSITFVIIHPRLAGMKYGNCSPQSEDDFDFLKKLRKSSHEVVVQIGVDNDQ